jgi:polyisoprenyl-phosphate glycosyltransferase
MGEQGGLVSAIDIPELSVIIPCFNEEQNVEAICAAVTKEAEAHVASHEIILIDNGSSDRTREIIRDVCRHDMRIRAIFNTRNFGQMRSPTYAMYQTEGRGVISMCADFQDPPALIGPMVAQWRAGAQVVLGQRRSEKSSFVKSITRKIGYGLLGRVGDYAVIPGATGFGLYDRVVVDALAKWHEPEPFVRGMVVESGYRLSLIPFDRPERARGTSSNSLGVLISFFISGLAGSSKGLLRQPLMLCLPILALAIVLLLGTVGLAAFGGPSLGLFAITLQVAIFGILMLFIGLLGEQVRLIAERTRCVPLVLEAERINFPPERAHPSLRTHVS